MFRKKNRLIGLDIGSGAIKVAEVLESDKGWEVKNFAMIDLPPGCIEDGNIRTPEAVVSAIRQLLQSLRIKETHTAISLGGYSVIVKKITTARATEEQLHNSIHFEAEQYIPFDINEVNIDFQILDADNPAAEIMPVLLVAAKKDIVNSYIDVLMQADLTPCVVDVDAFALQNIYEVNFPEDERIVALIDVGASKTSLNIIRNGTSLFLRDVSLGCGQITQRIAGDLGCSLTEAEAIKFSDDTRRLPLPQRHAITQSVITDWTTEIHRAIDFFYSTFPDDQIDRILVSGGGAHIESFRNMLTADTATDVEIFNPFQGLSVDLKRNDASYLQMVAPQAAICLGLALRRINDK